MKNKIFLSIFSLLIVTASCTSVEKKQTSKEQEQSTEKSTRKFMLNVTASSMEWTCGKLVGGEHQGSVTFIDGSFDANDAKAIAAVIHIDMKSISNSDITGNAHKADLINHLKSEDFFNTDKFPTATIQINKISMLSSPVNGMNSTIDGVLTIKGVSNAISFPAKIEMSDATLNATASLTIDRKNWGINYGTEGSVANLAKDRIINNQILFKVKIVADKVD